ncbi:MAG: prepilin-type N-terminal cleavage/methylation domain-containing protein [Betaproteobacteria bacterium]|nr:prepilin-type N-terminal cleavage/methylation domain-containing protein [Betaproteobacteria bacterium]
MAKPVGKGMTQTLVIGNNESGFSLIELLVVLVIIGISFALITLSIHVVDPSNLQSDAKRLVATINQAHDIEDLSGSPVLLVIDCHQWHFFDTSTNELVPMSKEQVSGGTFKTQLVSIAINSTELNCAQGDSLKLMINDDLSPVKVSLNTEKQSSVIVSDTLGRFQLQQP